MQITLNDKTAEIVNSLTTDNLSATEAVELAVDTLAWVKTEVDAGKTVLAAKPAEAGWVEEDFFPENMLAVFNPAADDAAE